MNFRSLWFKIKSLKCRLFGHDFSRAELKMAILHYKKLVEVLSLSGREFKFAADAAYGTYCKLYDWGIARNYFTRDNKTYSLNWSNK